MKKGLLAVLVFSVIAAGCADKVKQLLSFTKEIEYNGSVEIKGVPGLPDTVVTLPSGGLNADFPKLANATNAQQYIKDYNTSPDKISNVIISKLGLEMSEPSGANFDYIDSVKVYISATGMEEHLVGYKYGIPKGTQSIDLTRDDINLKEYFLKDSIYFRINAHFVEVPKDSGKMDIKSVFSLVATPLN